jgi:hypothetical protein|tara:strand:- start:2667 stop:2966 length:300 start_codon:yes stop_codon:yes gene_type:complete
MKVEITKNKLTRIKKKVLKEYPKAKCMMRNGGYYIWDGSDDYIQNEYMIPLQRSSAMAWYWFNEINKTNTNIQRTHPNRMCLDTFNKKFERISNRNKKK